MLCFTITLRSPKSTDQWPSVLSNFESTLASVFNQTCNEFYVYVGCNEIPSLRNYYDERLRWVCTDTPAPKDYIEGLRDRAWKQLACCVAIRKDFPYEVSEEKVFVFPVDADDYISNRIVQYVAQHQNANGFKSTKAYRYYKGSKKLELSPYFGGTMNIMKLLPDEFPEEMPDIGLCFDKETCVQLNDKYPVRWNDIDVEEKMKCCGRPMENLPFPSTIYVLNTGANISFMERHEKGRDKAIHLGVLLNKMNISKWRYLSKRIRNEFGMKEI